MRRPPDRDVGQDRRARQVVVPDFVVGDLEVPAALAGLQVDGDEAVAEQVVARPVPAVEVVGRRLGRNVDEPQLLVGRHLAPGAGVARIRPGVVQPALAAELVRRRHRMEDPQPPARAHVVAAHVALHVAGTGRHDVGGRVVRGVRRADDDDIVGDDRRGLQADVGIDRIDLLVVVAPQVDHAVPSEIRDRPAGPRVQRDQRVARRDVHDPLVRAVRPVRQSAAGQPARRRVGARALVDAEHPLELAGRGVEREHRPPRAAGGVQHAADHERGRLVVRLGARSEIVRAEPPRDFQLAEVGVVDLVQRRVARIGEIRAVGRPFARRAGCLCRGGRRRQQAGQKPDRGPAREIPLMEFHAL